MDSVTEYMDVPRSVSLPTATLQLSRFKLWAGLTFDPCIIMHAYLQLKRNV